MIPKRKCVLVLPVALVLTIVCACGHEVEPIAEVPASPAAPPPAQEGSPAAQRQPFATRLVREGPAPQDWTDEALPPGVERVEYPSAGRNLKAWLVRARTQQPAPVLVYLHGGFAFSVEELEVCRKFRDAGYHIFAPTVRGENGNPGSFELFLGEVDDVAAALAWIGSQPYVDGNRVFVFGHSIGGALSALTTLRPDVKTRLSGSSGGLYANSVFDGWAEIVPFDATRQEERDARLLFGRILEMQRAHIAYIGLEDGAARKAALMTQEVGEREALLQIVVLPGDHFTSLAPALDSFLAEAEKAGQGL